MTILRQDTDYAMRFLVELGRRAGETMSTPAMAEATGAPLPYAHKILRKLAACGIVRCTRGARGGYCLARPASDVSLAAVVEAVQGPLAVNKCLLGDALCPRKNGCSISRKLSDLQTRISGLLEETKLSDVLGEADGCPCKPLEGGR